MKVKRYTAATMQRALKQISEELGPDAVILSNQRVNGRLEIVAAAGYEEESVAAAPEIQPTQMVKPGQATNEPMSAAQLEVANRKLALQDELEKAYQYSQQTLAERSSGFSSVPVPSAPQVKEQHELSEMKAEIHVLKSMLEKSVQPSMNFWGNWIPRNPLQANLWQRLDDLGIEHWLAQQLLQKLDGSEILEDAWRQVLRQLAKSIPVMNDSSLAKHKCIALLGATGVGKTTTLGKMAAEHVLQYGNDKIVIISTDNYRIGAQEQLRSFARILSIPLYSVDEQKSLADILNKIPLDHKVFIDTAGMHPKDPQFAKQLTMLKSVASRVTCMLTLDSTSQGRVLNQTFKQYKQANIDAVILTKLDDALALGEALSVAIKQKLPLSYFTDGQRIPEDIHRASAKELLRQALVLSPDHGHINITSSQQGRVSAGALK